MDWVNSAPVNYDYVSTSFDNELATIDSLHFTENTIFIQKDNKYNELYEIKQDLLKYLKNDTEEIDAFVNEEEVVESDDKEVVESDDKDKNDEVEEIDKNDELITKFNEFIKSFKEQQDTLLKCEQELLIAINNNKQDIKTINQLMDHTKNLTNKYIDEKSPKNNIIDKMCELGKEIKKNSNINSIKDDYVNARKDINKSLNIIKYFNGLNIGNTCSMCLTNNVDVYFDPCGHTCCEECSKKLPVIDKRCILCRVNIRGINKIYYN